jgi:SAM-dependent methyltransferase
MDIDRIRALLTFESFPRSAKYDPLWVVRNSMGPHPLVLTEWACQALTLRAGDRVLDMGCGKALSSVFLAQEFDVQVWATDLWIRAEENLAQVRDLGLGDRIFPIHADARNLPFAQGFFDAIVCIDSYFYYGTDERYLPYFSQFVRPGGAIGIVVPGLTRPFGDAVPAHLLKPQRDGAPFWRNDGDCWCFHTADWWKALLSQRGLLDLDIVDTMPEGWRVWAQHERALEMGRGESYELSDAEPLEEDAGRYLGFVRAVGHRRNT